ncbi:MAG: hypothetical protein KZQ83_20525 [gamma proteobacterium symbiont of Taylorina sp.]|nr:hypothetical protein [gamma proteobacterium symbiont of Taylorina sp.]
MSKQDKLIQKLHSAKTFKWSEITTLLKMLGFTELQGDGSRVKFNVPVQRNF